MKSAPACSPAARLGIDTGLVEIDRVSVVFGKGRQAHLAVEQTSIRVEPGEFVCLLGPSGCGKSTLLNSVAGYVRPGGGAVRVDGALITAPGPDRGHGVPAVFAVPVEDRARERRVRPEDRRQAGGRDRRCVPRHGRPDALRQPLSRRALRRHAAAGRHRARARQLAERAADGRAVRRARCPDPHDDAGEPAADLERVRQTVLFVTHDIDEAMFLADRVLIMSAGPGRIIAECGRPAASAPSGDGDRARLRRLKRQCLARSGPRASKPSSSRTVEDMAAGARCCVKRLCLMGDGLTPGLSSCYRRAPT